MKQHKVVALLWVVTFTISLIGIFVYSITWQKMTSALVALISLALFVVFWRKSR